ncbi:3165_t:CDS:2, partial [Diversispora eburnea]
HLPVLKLMAPTLAKFQLYIGQEPPDEYLDKVIQSWAYLEGHIPKIIEAPVISQLPDTQKMIDEALAKQKSNYDAEIEKLRKEVQSSKAQKTQVPVLQTIESVRQPRGPPSNLKTDKDYEDYY